MPGGAQTTEGALWQILRFDVCAMRRSIGIYTSQILAVDMTSDILHENRVDEIRLRSGDSCSGKSHITENLARVIECI